MSCQVIFFDGALHFSLVIHSLKSSFVSIKMNLSLKYLTWRAVNSPTLVSRNILSLNCSIKATSLFVTCTFYAESEPVWDAAASVEFLTSCFVCHLYLSWQKPEEEIRKKKSRRESGHEWLIFPCLFLDCTLKGTCFSWIESGSDLVLSK